MVFFISLGSMHGQHAVALPADDAMHPPSIVMEFQLHAPALQAAQGRNQFRGTDFARDGAYVLHMRREHGILPARRFRFLAVGNRINVNVSATPQPAPKAVSAFDDANQCCNSFGA